MLAPWPVFQSLAAGMRTLDSDSVTMNLITGSASSSASRADSPALGAFFALSATYSAASFSRARNALNSARPPAMPCCASTADFDFSMAS